jgi:hypothetical protein
VLWVWAESEAGGWDICWNGRRSPARRSRTRPPPCLARSHIQNTNGTANDGPVRIQYKCLVPIYVFPEIKLCSLIIFKNRITTFCLTVSTVIYLCEIYIFPGSVCLPCCSQICGRILGILYINRSQTHECRNWDWGRTISFPGINSILGQCVASLQILWFYPWNPPAIKSIIYGKPMGKNPPTRIRRISLSVDCQCLWNTNIYQVFWWKPLLRFS